jgi:hypothetical protein
MYSLIETPGAEGAAARLCVIAAYDRDGPAILTPAATPAPAQWQSHTAGRPRLPHRRTIPLAMYSLIETPGAEGAAARLCVIAIVLALASLLASEVLPAPETPKIAVIPLAGICRSIAS